MQIRSGTEMTVKRVEEKKKGGSKKSSKESSSSGSSSGSDTEEDRPKKREEKPKKEEAKKPKTRSKNGGKRESTSKPKPEKVVEKPEKTERQPTVERPKSDSRSQNSGIFGADFDAQFSNLQVKDDDTKFGDFADFRTSQKPTMAKSSDFESFFSEPAPSKPSGPVASQSVSVGHQESHDTPSNNKPAKEAIMALFAQPTQTSRGYPGYEMQNGGYQQPVYPQGYQYSQYPPQYPYSPAFPLSPMNAQQGMMAYPPQYGRPSSFGFGTSAFGMPAAQPQAFGSVNLGTRQAAPTQTSAFEGLF